MPDNTAIIETMRTSIQEAMKESHPSGLAMTLVSGDEAIWTEAFGYLDKTKKTTVDTETLFSIQSTSKFVNGIVFMLAVQEGLIGLDDPLVKYFPEFKVKSRWGPDEGSKITYRHLLSHQSGLPQMTRVGSCFDATDHTFEEHIHSIIDTWLESPVGHRYSYSNIGMDLVSYSIEQVSGMSFPEFVDQKLAKPLGINIVYGSIEAKKNPNRVIGYEHPEIAIEIGTALAYGCGGVWMNIADLAVLTQFLLNKGKHNGTQILREDLIEEMMTSQIEGDEGYSYGFGTSIMQGSNVRIVEHAGGGFGYAGLLAIAPDHGLGACVEINAENVTLVYKLVMQAINLALKERGIERTVISKEDLIIGPKKEVSDSDLSRLKGYYRGVGGGMTVKVNEGKLVIDVGGNATEMSVHNETVFTSEAIPSVARFTLDEDDRPYKMTLITSQQGPIDLFYKESLGLDESNIEPNDKWKDLTGLYRTRYYGVHMFYIAVKVIDGKLVYNDWSGPITLVPFGTEPMNFFTVKGEHYEFGEDHFRFNNKLATRVDDPIGDVKKTIENGSPKSMLTDWVMDQEIRLLEFLERNEEAESLRKLRNEIHGEKK